MTAKHVKLCSLVQMVGTLLGSMELMLKLFSVRTGKLLLKLYDPKSALFNSPHVAHILQHGNHPLVILYICVCMHILIISIIKNKICVILVTQANTQGTQNCHIWKSENGELVQSFVQKKQTNW